MKRYKVTWGGSFMTFDCDNPIEAIKIVCKTWSLECSQITSVVYLGDTKFYK